MAIIRVRDNDGIVHEIPALRGEKGDPGEVSAAYLHGACANALKGTAEGALVQIKDISPLEHELAVKLESKNRYYNTATKNQWIGAAAVTITEGESSVVINGTVGTTAALKLSSDIPLKAGTYTASLHGANVINASSYVDRIFIEYKKADGTTVTVNNIIQNVPRTFNVDCDTTASVSLVCSGESSYENKRVSVQIERGVSATDYTPHIADLSSVTVTASDGETSAAYSANVDGTVEGIKSIGSNMTFRTDTNGVAVTVSYSRDIRTVIEKLTQAIVSLGGNV